jgi:N-terminal domain of toast_rack, DUF2154
MHRENSKPGLLAVVATLAVVSACTIGSVPVGELETESKSVELGGAKLVRAEIHMGAGELKVRGGATKLLDADFAYNVARWQPEVDYTVTEGQGHLEVRQPPGTGGPMGNARYEWDLRFNNAVPLELTVELGAGRADLVLGSLSLGSLDLKMGAGETIVDLTGSWKNDVTARIQGGVGKATVRLPQDVGVRVSARGGIGAINAHGFRKDHDAYVNDAYGKSDVTVRVDVQGGVGEINLELAEAPPVV